MALETSHAATRIILSVSSVGFGLNKMGQCEGNNTTLLDSLSFDGYTKLESFRVTKTGFHQLACRNHRWENASILPV
jgi:hypothetical protein